MDVRLIEEVMYKAYKQNIHSEVRNEASRLKLFHPKLAAGLRYKMAFENITCLLYTSPSPRDRQKSRMPSSA